MYIECDNMLDSFVEISGWISGFCYGNLRYLDPTRIA